MVNKYIKATIISLCCIITAEVSASSSSAIVPYSTNNDFYRILHGLSPCRKVLEGRHFLAFEDKYPRAPVHILIIPKGNYVDVGDYLIRAKNEEKLEFLDGIKRIIEMKNLSKRGFKLLTNAGNFRWIGGYPHPQTVMHMHVHIVGAG